MTELRAYLAGMALTGLAMRLNSDRFQEILWGAGAGMGEAKVAVTLADALVAELKGQSEADAVPLAPSQDLSRKLRELRNEVNCRLEHGADGRGHLLYVQDRLGEIIKELEP